MSERTQKDAEASSRSGRSTRKPRQADLIRPPAKQAAPKKPALPEPKKAGPGAYCLLLLLAFVGFAPMLASDLLWTDYDLVERSAYGSLDGWAEAWTWEQALAENPVALSSYYWERALPGPPAAIHRSLNLLLHLLGAALLLKCLETLKLPGAFAAATIFALHPTVLQILFWPGYRDQLIALIVIGAACFFGLRNRSSVDYLAMMLLLPVACFFHPAGLLIPAVVAAGIFLQQRRLKLHYFNRVLPPACLALFLGIWLARAGEPESAAAGEAFATLQLGERNFYFFLRQTLLPFNLDLFHPAPALETAAGADDFNYVPLLLSLPCLALVCFKLKHRWARGLLVGSSLCLLFILPSIARKGFFLDGSPALEEQTHYLALPVLIAFVIVGSAALARRAGLGAVFLWRIGIGCLICLQLGLSIAFAYSVSDQTRLWEDFAADRPDSWVPKLALIERTDASEAYNLSNDAKIELLVFILQERPEMIEQRKLLARIYAEERQRNNAVREYKRILRETEPEAPFLLEAAAFFDRVGLRWEADNARKRAEAAAP